nr:hypothetical protein [Roseburia inulinivorans]
MEEIGMSSNPTTLISSGTRKPRSLHSVITPDAIRSLPQMIAVAPAPKKVGT